MQINLLPILSKNKKDVMSLSLSDSKIVKGEKNILSILSSSRVRTQEKKKKPIIQHQFVSYFSKTHSKCMF